MAVTRYFLKKGDVLVFPNANNHDLVTIFPIIYSRETTYQQKKEMFFPADLLGVKCYADFTVMAELSNECTFAPKYSLNKNSCYQPQHHKYAFDFKAGDFII